MSTERLAPKGGIQQGIGTAYMRSGDQLPLLLTADETAVLLRTTRKAVYAMVERGQLPGLVRIGRRILFRTDLLLGWLDGSRAPSLKEDWR